MPLLLELFSGTGSIGRAFAAQGWDVISVDCDRRAHATIRADVSQFEVSRELRGRTVDCIWASPPCTNYSIARTRKRSTAEELEFSDSLVKKTLEIARELEGNPALFIENPYTGKLKSRGLLDHLQLNKVDYCKYGFNYRKRTAVWSNTQWTPERPLCKGDCAAYGTKGHTAIAQRGGPGHKFSQRDLYRIPPDLCDEIARYCTARARGNELAGAGS